MSITIHYSTGDRIAPEFEGWVAKGLIGIVIRPGDRLCTPWAVNGVDINPDVGFEFLDGDPWIHHHADPFLDEPNMVVCLYRPVPKLPPCWVQLTDPATVMARYDVVLHEDHTDPALAGEEEETDYGWVVRMSAGTTFGNPPAGLLHEGDTLWRNLHLPEPPPRAPLTGNAIFSEPLPLP